MTIALASRVLSLVASEWLDTSEQGHTSSWVARMSFQTNREFLHQSRFLLVRQVAPPLPRLGRTGHGLLAESRGWLYQPEGW